MRKNPDVAYALSPGNEDIPKPVRAEPASNTERTYRFAARIGENLNLKRANGDIKKATHIGSYRHRRLRRSWQIER
jgi:translation elongation factor EF-Ts